MTTGHKYLEIGINVGPLLRGDRDRRSSRKRADTVSRNVEGVLRTTRTHSKLSLESLGYSERFYQHWTANCEIWCDE